VKTIPPNFFVAMSMFLRTSFSAFVFLLGGSASINAAASGFLEGRLKILSLNEVEPAGEIRETVAPDYKKVILKLQPSCGRAANALSASYEVA
jgi:hypothetical protein